MKIKVRKARVSDVRKIMDKLFDFYRIIREKGARDIAKDDDVLWGGVGIEVGQGFHNPNWFCVVGDRVGELVSLMIGVLEFCSPVSEHLRCVRICANYSENDSLVGPRVVTAMWELVHDWAKENGAEYFYCNIHPGNAPSIRAAKHVGFKHHYTQFYRPLELETPEE
jgi:hypothetical protein